MEAHSDSAVVPFVWQVEVANALGEAVVHGKVPLGRALEIWDARKLSSPIDNYLSGVLPPLVISACRAPLRNLG
jgi:hypothetical protein